MSWNVTLRPIRAMHASQMANHVAGTARIHGRPLNSAARTSVCFRALVHHLRHSYIYAHQVNVLNERYPKTQIRCHTNEVRSLADPLCLDKMRGDDADDEAQPQASDHQVTANTKYCGKGKFSTLWSMSCSGKTSATNKAMLSEMRCAPHLGQKPRRLQQNATRHFAWQLSYYTLRRHSFDGRI